MNIDNWSIRGMSSSLNETVAEERADQSDGASAAAPLSASFVSSYVRRRRRRPSLLDISLILNLNVLIR